MSLGIKDKLILLQTLTNNKVFSNKNQLKTHPRCDIKDVLGGNGHAKGNVFCLNIGGTEGE